MTARDEDHRPDLEEVIRHTISDHGCGLMRSLVKLIEHEAVAEATAGVGRIALPPGEPHRVDVRLGDALAANYDRLHALHDAHHLDAGEIVAHVLKAKGEIRG